MRIFIWIFVLVALLVSCGQGSVSSGVAEALSNAGANRSELFHVLRHYEDNGDSLKLCAAQFLIGSMADKGYLTGKAIDEYYTFIDSVYQISQEEYDIPYI